MLSSERRVWVARVAAPAAFLVAVTAGVLAVRSAQTNEPSPAVTTAPRFPAAPPPTPEAAARFYVVRNGDTLAAIADRNGTTVERLLELNPGIDPVALPVGERIRVG